MTAIEATGNVDAEHHLHLDGPLPIGPGPVRVIILVPEVTEMAEADWAKAAAAVPAFDFLKDAAEDIYKISDGKPFHDQR
jgi:hypothetical protein